MFSKPSEHLLHDELTSCGLPSTGMAVAYGRFFPNMEFQSIVAGAPRSQGTGQVVFFSKVRTDSRVAEFFQMSGN